MLQPPPPPVATELLYFSLESGLLPDFLVRKIPFNGNFCFLHNAKLLPTLAALCCPENFPMSITSRVSLDGLRREPVEPETPLTPFLNFNLKRDLKP